MIAVLLFALALAAAGGLGVYIALGCILSEGRAPWWRWAIAMVWLVGLVVLSYYSGRAL